MKGGRGAGVMGLAGWGLGKGCGGQALLRRGYCKSTGRSASQAASASDALIQGLATGRMQAAVSVSVVCMVSLHAA
jgi:hypothetical protein